MLKHRVIPALLLRDGGLVKTQKFGKHKYIGDPINAIRIFNEGISGKEVSVKDLKTITGSDFQIILDEIIAAGDDAIVA